MRGVDYDNRIKIIEAKINQLNSKKKIDNESIFLIGFGGSLTFILSFIFIPVALQDLELFGGLLVILIFIIIGSAYLFVYGIYRTTETYKLKKISLLQEEIKSYKKEKFSNPLIQENTFKNIKLYKEYQERFDEKLNSFDIDYPKECLVLKTKDNLEVNIWINNNRLFFAITNNLPFKKNFLLNNTENVDDAYDHQQKLEAIYQSLNYITLESILYYNVEGIIGTETKTTGGGGTAGGISISGAAIGGLLFGPVGMLIGSRKEATFNEVKTETLMKDDRRLVLYYKSGSTTRKIEFSPEEYANLKAFLPDYDLDVVNQKQAMSSRVEKPETQKLTEKTSTKAEKIKELKAMLDDNIIDKQEFEILKKEILGQ